MSSISSSDRARQDDKIRQTREEYESRELENSKRRNAELKRLEQNYAEQLKNVTENYEDQLTDLKSRSRESLNERDFANNRKIEEVRQTYRDSLKNKMEESYNLREMQKNAYEAQLEKNKQLTESQRENLKSQMGQEVVRRDETYSEAIEQARIKSQESTQKTTKKLNEAHEKERNIIVKGNEDLRQNQLRGQNAMRRSFEDRLRQSERQREADNSRWSQKYADTVVNKSLEFGENLQGKQEIMNGELEAIRDKYQAALEKKSVVADENTDNFRDSVNNRLDSQIRSRDSKIQSLSSKLNSEMSKHERLRGIERKNLTNAYEKRLDLVNQQREDAVEVMKDLNGERIEKTLDSNQKLLRSFERQNKSQRSLANAQHRQDRENLITQHKDQVTQVANTADTRVKKVLDLTNKNLTQAERYYADSLDVVKSNYENRMESYRDKTTNDHVNTSKVMTERFRGMESAFNNKLELTKKAYEDKIAKMTEDQQKELKRLENSYSVRVNEKDKAQKMEKETIAMKYEAKVAQLNESHKDQLDRMNRRHQEDMQNLSVKMSSYNRKA